MISGSIKFLADQSLRGFIHAPFHTAESGRSVENVLAVLQIKHRVTTPREPPVAGRQIDQNVAAIPAEFAIGKPDAVECFRSECGFRPWKRACIGEKNRRVATSGSGRWPIIFLIAKRTVLAFIRHRA